MALRLAPTIVLSVNETLSDLFDAAMERTVTVSAPKGSPAVKVRLLHAGAAALAGIIFAPRAVAVGAIAALVKGVRVSVDAPIAADI